MLKLELPSRDLLSSYVDCIQELVDEGLRPNEQELREQIKKISVNPDWYFTEWQRLSDGKDLKQNKVSKITYWIVMNNIVVGTLVFKPMLQSDHPYPSHIGYAIKTSERGKGYATAAVRQAILMARNEYGITEIHMACNADNLASKMVIEKNGGIAQTPYTNPDGEVKLRYKISVI